MVYIDGFVIAVPTTSKDKFIKHARTADEVFMEHGARRILECWGEDVPHGKQTDFYGSVQANEDETVVFSWIEWPDKESRDRQNAKLEEVMKTDPRFDPETNPMPFDGKRMIYGGFQPIVDEGKSVPGSYIQGFIVPVPETSREDYRKMAQEAWPMFQGYGALRLVEAWGDDVPEGKVTDFYRAAKCTPEEKVVFSYMEWPSREVCDAAARKMESDEDMKLPEGMEMPFDGKRMIFGGFVPVVELGE